MSLRARGTAVVVLAACMAVLGGCGSDDEGQPIPAITADELESRLQEVERRLADGSVGACTDILDDTEPAVDDVLASLPQDVDARDALQESFDRLFQLTDEQCSEQQAEPDRTDTEPTETTETDTVPTATEPTDTTETDTVPTDTTDTGTDTTDTGAEPPPGQTDGTTLPGEDGSGGAGAPGEED